MRTHAEWAEARNVAAVCTPAHVGFGGVCRNCGYPDANRRTDLDSTTMEQVLDKLHAAGVEIVVNGRST